MLLQYNAVGKAVLQGVAIMCQPGSVLWSRAYQSPHWSEQLALMLHQVINRAERTEHKAFTTCFRSPTLTCHAGRCANYIKLPPYSSYEVLRERVLFAVREGQGSFDLS